MSVITGGTYKGVEMVDFGFAAGNEDFTTSVTVTAPWVTVDTTILVNYSGTSTTDHDPDDYGCEHLTAYACNIVPGVSFDIVATAPFGTWGKYNIFYTGV